MGKKAAVEKAIAVQSKLNDTTTEMTNKKDVKMNERNDRNRDMTGVLFVNDKRETDNHPHYTGRIVIGGKQFSLSAWEKESAAGKPYLSLAVREWVERPARDRDEDGSSTLLA